MHKARVLRKKTKIDVFYLQKVGLEYKSRGLQWHVSCIETAIVLRLENFLVKTHLHENRNATSERILPDCEVANFRDIEKKHTALNWI